MSVQLDEATIAAYLRGEVSRADRAEIEAALDRSPEWLAVGAALAPEGPSSPSRFGPASEHNTDDVAALERAPILAVGARVGRFEVQGRIAAGGMGVVYAAYDGELRRPVALKLSRHRPRDSAARDRLLGEARALAQLTHPNIVSVFDVGTHEGRLYMAMERLQGPTLAAVLRARDRDWRALVGLFVQAAQGLDAAHRKGIVHRDFKPDNAIVEGERVVVIDFGLAAAPSIEAPGTYEEGVDGDTFDTLDEPGPASTSDDGRTPRTPTRVGGTPAYMAPEHRRGEAVTARSDQYSLAVALHQALYGVLPPSTRARSSGPPSPATAAIPRRLQGALARALSEDPEDRFADMGEFIVALERGRRRRWPRIAAALAMGAGATAVAVAAFAAGASTSAEVDVSGACEVARTELDGVWSPARAETLQLRYESFQRPYLSALGHKMSAAVDAYAEDWRAANEASCRADLRGERSPETLALERRCLSGLRGRLDGLLSSLTTADVELAAHSLEGLGELPKPRRCAEFEALRQQDAAPAEAAAQAELAAIEVGLTRVQLLHRARHLDEAAAQAEALVERAAALEHAPTLAEARAELAWIRSTAGDQKEARAELDRALLAAEHGHHDRLLAITWIRRIWVAYEDGAVDEGRRVAAHADAWLTRLGDPPELRFDYNQHLGWLEQRAGDPERSRAYFEVARDLAVEAELGERERALAENGIATAHLALGELDAAAESFVRAAERLASALGEEHPDVAKVSNNLAAMRRAQGDLDAAEALFLRSREILRAAYGEGHELVAQITLNLGTLELDRGHYAEALELLVQAQALLEAAVGPDHPMIALALSQRGDALTQLGRHDEGRVLYSDALARTQAAYGDDYPGLATIEHNIGLGLDLSGRPEEAVDHYRAALRITEAAYGPEHSNIATIATSLAITLDGLGRAAEARALHTRAIALADPLIAAEARTRFGEHLLRAGETTAALEMLDRARELHDETPTDRVMAGQTWFALAKARRAAATDEQERVEARAAAVEAQRIFAEEDEPELAAEVDAWLRGRPKKNR